MQDLKNSNHHSFDIKSKLYDTLFKTFPDLVIIMDSKGKIVDISDMIYKLYGTEIQKKDYIGKNLIDFIVSEEKEAALKTIDKILNDGFIRMVEHKFITEDGSDLIGELSISTIQNENDKPKFLLAIFRDITKQKEIERELRENKNMFQLVMDNIPQFISWKDINSVYLGCNQNFARVAGVDDPSKIIGKTDYDLPWKISEAESFFEIDQLVMDTNKPEYHIIEPQLQADGKRAWLDTNKIPLDNSKGDVVGLLCTYEDITDRVKAEKALTSSEKKYREAYNRAEFYKDIFAHDISNILQNILSSVELSSLHLQNIQDNSELTEIFKIIKGQIMRGANLVSNVRKLSILDDTESLTQPTEILGFLNKSTSFIYKNFPEREINIKIDTSFKEYHIRANALLLDVFNNLLFNAVKHNKNKIVNILIRSSEVQRQLKNYLKIEFIDNGIGIPDDQKRVIFQSNEQKQNTFSRIGLGLSLVYKIINSFEGQIWIEDKVKGDYTKGSNFVILLQKSKIK